MESAVDAVLQPAAAATPSSPSALPSRRPQSPLNTHQHDLNQKHLEVIHGVSSPSAAQNRLRTYTTLQPTQEADSRSTSSFRPLFDQQQQQSDQANFQAPVTSLQDLGRPGSASSPTRSGALLKQSGLHASLTGGLRTPASQKRGRYPLIS